MTTASSSDQPMNDWVVGFDGSPSSLAAARWAVAHATGRAESIRLVHSWTVSTATVMSPFDPIVLAENADTVERAAVELTESFATELRAVSSVPITAVVVQGDPSNSLLHESANAEHLVVGARGNGPFDRLLLGSISTRCATHAVVPTTVVRPSDDDHASERASRIVVAFDGSPNAIAAVEWACTFADPDTHVDVIAVWEFTPSLYSLEPFHYPDAIDAARHRFDEQIAALPAPARRDDVAVDAHFLEGRPRDRVRAFCHEVDADLLVVGARGRGAIGAALLGSVSTWLLHHVAIPMVVVPHHSDA